MKKIMTGMVAGMVLWAGVARGDWPGPQDAWYEVDAWYSWEENGATNYLGQSLSAMRIGPDENLYVLDDSSNRVVVFEQDGTFVRQWGGQGNTPGKFYFGGAGDIAFGPTGRVYIADLNNHRIQVFEGDGTFVAMWGKTNQWGNPTPGSEPGQFSSPHGVEMSPDGRVYVTDYGNYRVQVFEEDGTFVRAIGSQGNLEGQFSGSYPPRGLAFGPDGLLYVNTDSYSSRATQAFTPDGSFVKGFPGSVGMWMDYMDGVLIGERGMSTTDGLWLRGRNWNSTNLVPLASNSDEGTYFDWKKRAYVRDGATYWHGTVVKCKRRYAQWPIQEWKAGISPVPNPVVLGFEQRPGNYVMDIDYMVQDADSETVQVAMLAFKDGVNRLDRTIPMRTFLEGTAANVGDGVSANTTNHVVWDITADVTNEYVNLRIAVMAHDGDRGLWDVEFITLPAEGEAPELTISRRGYYRNELVPVWQWLLARGNEGVELRSDGLYATEGTYAGQRLGYDCGEGQFEMTEAGRNFLAARMGYRIATNEELTRAQAGVSWNNFVWNGGGYLYFVKE